MAQGTGPLKRPAPAVKKRESLVLENVPFIFGKSGVSPETTEILDRMSVRLKEYPKVKLEIREYSNDSGDRGMRLSQQRADAVKDYLVKKGIAADRLTAKGAGASRLLAPTTTPEGRRKNRRVEFAIVG